MSRTPSKIMVQESHDELAEQAIAQTKVVQKEQKKLDDINKKIAKRKPVRDLETSVVAEGWNG